MYSVLHLPLLLLQIPAAWHSLLDAVTAAYQQACGLSLVGVYLRGSLPRGCFIPHVSDVDTFALVLAPATATGSSRSSSSSDEDGGGSSSRRRGSTAGTTLASQTQQQVKDAAAALMAEHAQLSFVKVGTDLAYAVTSCSIAP